MSEDNHHPAQSLKLASGEYRLVVAPALAAAAEIAAERGDPQLFNDMASMLALSWMVEGLVAAYRRDIPQAVWQSSDEAMMAAPLGACALVFTESDLDENQVSDCIGALGQAGHLLKADGVDQAGAAALASAWAALQSDAYEQAIDQLKQCAAQLAEAVDEWERRRSANPEDRSGN